MSIGSYPRNSPTNLWTSHPRWRNAIPGKELGQTPLSQYHRKQELSESAPDLPSGLQWIGSDCVLDKALRRSVPGFPAPGIAEIVAIAEIGAHGHSTSEEIDGSA